MLPVTVLVGYAVVALLIAMNIAYTFLLQPPLPFNVLGWAGVSDVALVALARWCFWYVLVPVHLAETFYCYHWVVKPSRSRVVQSNAGLLGTEMREGRCVRALTRHPL